MQSLLESIQTALGGDAGLLVGLILLGVLCSQVALLAYSTLRRLTHEQTQRRLDRERLETLVRAARMQWREVTEATMMWNGCRKFTVARKVYECPDVHSLYLAPHDRKSLPAFKPGQYLTFNLYVPGRDKAVVRCYSLSDSPGQADFYRITVKREPPPPDQPGVPPGVASNYFCQTVKEGDILDVKAPAGHFFLDLSKNTPVVLLAGGVGLTPLLSMAKAVGESGAKREVWLFFGCRSGQEHMLRADLEMLAERHGNIRVQVCYSRPGPGDIRGKDYHQEGRVTVELLKELLPSNNYEYYMCGNGSFMRALNDGLEAWGVPEKDIHYEAFGPATVKKTIAPETTAAAAAATRGVNVEFSKSGKSASWDPAVLNLLEFARAHGVRIDSGCCAGSCGSCVVALKSGAVEYLKKPDAPPEDGSCLTCICRPKGDLVLDA